ncbi:hypothetical protein PGTUg99_026725 [Puccinia graminis f. sp. tritici]|uniref:Uncharacterized protein n=1 Tax=Puccinia graminis f. sp. tritici TaxID=56615 RepID=A0A5B0SKE2_PUCGR|nr:hypothetical protein PGTUg99_026725 [Puccinia graminis f. sp. tritici]
MKEENFLITALLALEPKDVTTVITEEEFAVSRRNVEPVPDLWTDMERMLRRYNSPRTRRRAVPGSIQPKLPSLPRLSLRLPTKRPVTFPNFESMGRPMSAAEKFRNELLAWPKKVYDPRLFQNQEEIVPVGPKQTPLAPQSHPHGPSPSCQVGEHDGPDGNDEHPLMSLSQLIAEVDQYYRPS